MTETILKTKLFIPAPRPHLVKRPRLIEALNAGLYRKLTLISAPAGFGKTTLVSDWISQLDIPVAWLSLDEGDNDPTRFIRYLVSSLNQNPDIDFNNGETILSVLEAPQLPPIENILTMLINEIFQVSGRAILALDDYHMVQAQPVHEILEFLVENIPPQIHLVIATREDPQIPLARLRARDLLTELRASDLRFTSDEAAEFLNQVMGLELTKTDIESLENRTEGWITGLQMAAISMKSSNDITGFIQSFTGSNRHIMDYLIEDVLTQQSEETQDFLLQTSILERLNASLCDAVTGQENSQQVLNYLEQANLFIIPLDNDRSWYRYHQLFADLLQQRLQSQSPGTIAELHTKAARWYEEQGFLPEAIHHAFAGEDIRTAVRLIEKGAGAALERSDFGFIFNSVARLPEAEWENSPWLFIYYAWALVLIGKTDQIAQQMEDTSWLLDSITDKDELEKMKGYLEGLLAHFYSWRWNDEQMFTHAQQAFEHLPEDHWVLGYSAMAMGTRYWGTGELDKANEMFAKADAIAKASGHKRVSVTAVMYLVHTLEQQGRLQQALRLCQASFALTEINGREIPLAGYLHVEITRLFYYLNELEKAKQHTREGIKLCQQLGDNRLEKLGLYQLAWIHLAQGDLKGAEQAIQDAASAHSGVEPMVDMRGFEYPQVMLWLAQNKFKDIEYWLNETEIDLDSTPFFKAKLTFTMRARAMIRLGLEYAEPSYLQDAQKLLDKLHALVEGKGWVSKETEILALQALCLLAQEDFEAAVQTIEKAIDLAEPGGYIRFFLDEGPQMETLLKRVKPKDDRHKNFVRLLLTAFGTKEVPDQPLIDPLSEREIEVLELIAKGLTNQEIGAQLYLSLNTIKVHTRNIYSKLGVNNRTQAVSIARELEIISKD